MFYLLVTQPDRIIIAMTQKDPRPPEWALFKAEHNAIEVSVASEPSNFRDHRRLSDDGTTCEDVEETLSVAEERRQSLTLWARRLVANRMFFREMALDNALTTGMSDSAMLVSFVYMTLAAGGTDAVILNTTSWNLIKQNMVYMSKAQFEAGVSRGGRSGWVAAVPNMRSLRNFYTALGGVPTDQGGISSTQLQAGRAYADSVVFDHEEG